MAKMNREEIAEIDEVLNMWKREELHEEAEREAGDQIPEWTRNWSMFSLGLFRGRGV